MNKSDKKRRRAISETFPDLRRVAEVFEVEGLTDQTIAMKCVDLIVEVNDESKKVWKSWTSRTRGEKGVRGAVLTAVENIQARRERAGKAEA